MCKPQSTLLAALCLALATLGATLCAQAQQADRLPAHPELTIPVRLAGHVPRWANAANDAGSANDSAPLHLTFLLARAPEQQAAFAQLLADQQDPASPRYHQWLTPQQVGELYGPTQHDIDALTAWLAAHGLANPEVSPSRLFVNVTAPVATASATLSTSFHSFVLNGEPHIAATQEPAIPSAFAGMVDAIAGLADTLDAPMVHAESVPLTSSTGVEPRYTISSTSHYITPGDFGNIYNVAAATGNGFSGIGQRIAIIGRSRALPSDITEYEAMTGLAANLPNQILVNPSLDPGYTGTGDQLEATLDVDRALGTAPSAQVDLVILPSSGGGIFGAAQYAVNTLNDSVMNISFGSCELNAGLSGVKQWDTLFSQAAAQGISVFVSSDDAGAAGCDSGLAAPPATQVLSINYICASSYATCVGGTEFADGANPSFYWNSTNSAALVSASFYIPEGAWNEPTTTTNGITSYVAASTGGGASIYIAKPSWQIGTGVPADGARDVPDVSFSASGHDGYFACLAVAGGDCANGRFEYFYGTSAAAPSMAAITAIVNQRSAGRQGDFNPTLYQLAANSSTNSAFHDATPSSIGVANCTATIPSLCNNSTPSPTSLAGGLAGYALTPGYDQATGLGSLNVAYLVAALNPHNQSVSSITLTQTPAIVYTGNNVTFTASVTSSLAGTPTGWVQFFLSGATLGPAIALPASGVVSTPTTPYNSAFTGTIAATYSGDANYGAARSAVKAFSVVPPGFSITASPTKLTLTAGATTQNSATLTYTSFGGFAGVISQACSVGFNGTPPVTDLPTCSFSPPIVSLPAGGTVTGTITIGSTVPHLSPGAGDSSLRSASALGTLPALAFVLILLRQPGRRKTNPRLRLAVALASALAAAIPISGCGGEGGGSATNPVLVGTSAGSYTIYLTSSSGATAPTPDVSINLIIQ